MKIDVIYTNGRIRTLSKDHPEAHRMGVHNGRIVGLDDDLDGINAGRIVDLNGAPILPGFNDAHHHLSLRGRRLSALDLRSQVAPTLSDLYEAVKKRAVSLEPGEWVQGVGYDQNKIGSHPTAEGLDKVSGGRPVVLEHVSGHMLVASTAAFERAGFTGRRNVPDTPGGEVQRTADGLAEGLLKENAMRLIYRVTRPISVNTVLHNIEIASNQALSEGLTSATDPGLGEAEEVGNSPADFAIYQQAHEQRKLRIRMTLMPYITTLHYLGGFHDPEEWFGIDLGIRTGFGDEWLRIGPTKIVADGSLIGKSAAMRRPYDEEPTNKGFMRFEHQELIRIIVGAHKAGWSVAVHAIGDTAVDEALDGFEEAQRQLPRADARHRIEHFAVVSDKQVERLVRLGVIPVPQGRFISEIGDGMIRALGHERSETCYRMRSLVDAGAELPGSSDAPVVDGAPILGIHDMVNRRTASGQIFGAHEGITVEQAVRAYTYGSAYAVKEEQIKGKLTCGQLADFVVLSDDLFQVKPDKIASVKATATIVGGAVEYSDGTFAE